jgi:hypothetical protein
MRQKLGHLGHIRDRPQGSLRVSEVLAYMYIYYYLFDWTPQSYSSRLGLLSYYHSYHCFLLAY